MQDGFDEDVRSVSSHFAVTTVGAVRVISRAPAVHERDADAWRPANILFLVRMFLQCLAYPSLLLLPHDARLAEDALPMFAGTQWLLESDPTLWCIAGASGLGDRRGAGAAGGDALLLRTDAVPPMGAGLLLGRRGGSLLLRRWMDADTTTHNGSSRGHVKPSGTGWTTWLRHIALASRQQCIVPDVPRVMDAGGAASGGAGHDQTLSQVNMEDVEALSAQRTRAPANTGSHESLSEPAVGTATGPLRTIGISSGKSNGDAIDTLVASGTVDWINQDHSWLLEPSYSQAFIEVRDWRVAIGVGICCLFLVPVSSPTRGLH